MPEAVQRVVGAQVPHHDEEVGQRGHAVVVVGPLLRGPLRERRPVASVGEQDLARALGVAWRALLLEEVRVDQRRLEHAAGRPVPERAFRVELGAPAGQALLAVVPRVVRRGARVLEVRGPATARARRRATGAPRPAGRGRPDASARGEDHGAAAGGQGERQKSGNRSSWHHSAGLRTFRRATARSRTRATRFPGSRRGRTRTGR